MIAFDASKHSILVVEDDEQISSSLEQLLQMEGYNVLTAPDGCAGMKILKDAEPCVILLDLMMPVMDGWEFMDALKKDSCSKVIPIIITSAAGQKAVLAGKQVQGFISKPINVDLLLKKLQEYC